MFSTQDVYLYHLTMDDQALAYNWYKQLGPLEVLELYVISISGDIIPVVTMGVETITSK